MTIRVLLADDHTIVYEGLRVLLESQGDIKVVGVASNGRDAVRLAMALKPEIVVMDIAMTGLNGIEATQIIRKASQDTQVVILSMYATPEYIFRAKQAGALGYLLKESAGSEVINAIRMVNGGKSYLSKKISDSFIGESKILDKSPLERLSQRERQVLQLSVEGHTSAEIAKSLSLSPKTVETYRSRILIKLGLKDLPSLVKFAIQHGLTPL